MDKLLRVLLVVFAVLMISVPIGLLASGTAYGEWSTGELKQLVGFVPSGLDSMSNLWHAPFPDYSLPGLPNTFFGLSLGYYVSAMVGVAICVGAFILIGKVITRYTAKNNE